MNENRRQHVMIINYFLRDSIERSDAFKQLRKLGNRAFTNINFAEDIPEDIHGFAYDATLLPNGHWHYQTSFRDLFFEVGRTEYGEIKILKWWEVSR